MKKFPKIISLILAAVTVLFCFAGCGDAKNTDTKTEAPAVSTDEISTEPAETEPFFREADYKGEDFVIYMRGADVASYPGIYIITDEENANGDIVDTEVFNRNSAVEEKYKIKFSAKQVTSPHNTVDKDIKDGDPGYEVVLDRRCDMASQSTKAVYFNLKNLNVDFTSPWWEKNAYEQYQVYDKLYFMPNDVSVSNLAGVWFFYFNKRILDEYKLTSPYESVEKNNWTLETLVNLENSIENPEPEKLGVYGGLGHPIDSSARELIESCGIPYIIKNGNEITCTIGTDYADRFQMIVDTLKNVNPNAAPKQSYLKSLDSEHAGNFANTADHVRSLFAQGHGLLIMGNMKISNQFLDMKDAYGVVPCPKLNSDQPEYHHCVDKYAIIWCIPNSSDIDTEMVATVMDYWAYQSSKSVMPAFYELTLKSKRVSDPTAANMLDIIKGSISYYLTDIYTVGSITSLLDTAATSGSISSAWKTYEKQIKSGIASHLKNIKNAK